MEHSNVIVIKKRKALKKLIKTKVYVFTKYNTLYKYEFYLICKMIQLLIYS